MGRLSGIGIGDRVRLHGPRFAKGYITGTVADVKDEIFRLTLDDTEAPEALVYEALGGVRAVVWGSPHGVDAVERLEVAA